MYSKGTVARRDVTGEPSQVYDLHGNPEFIVGISSDVLEEYKLIKIPVTALRYFLIIRESGKLPINPEAD